MSSDALREAIIRAVAGLGGYEHPNTAPGDWWDRRIEPVVQAVQPYLAATTERSDTPHEAEHGASPDAEATAVRGPGGGIDSPLPAPALAATPPQSDPVQGLDPDVLARALSNDGSNDPPLWELLDETGREHWRWRARHVAAEYAAILAGEPK